jgi:hypothetical protein
VAYDTARTAGQQRGDLGGEHRRNRMTHQVDAAVQTMQPARPTPTLYRGIIEAG